MGDTIALEGIINERNIFIGEARCDGLIIITGAKSGFQPGGYMNLTVGVDMCIAGGILCGGSKTREIAGVRSLAVCCKSF